MHEQTGEGMRHDLTPLYGATAAGHLFPTAYAVGYYLAPFGLCAVADGGGAEERRCPGRTPPAYAAVLQ